jgi:hypothetical protein
MNIQHAIDEIKSKRYESYTKKSDIKRIMNAMESGEWEEVKKSRLYKLHGGEYCELLSILHRYVKE